MEQSNNITLGKQDKNNVFPRKVRTNTHKKQESPGFDTLGPSTTCLAFNDYVHMSNYREENSVKHYSDYQGL